MNAIVLITYNPNQELLNFYRKLINENHHVFVVVDDDDWINPCILNDSITYIKVRQSECFSTGFRKLALNPGIKNCDINGWDKALYYFSRVDTAYSHVWFLEDDVFIPSINTIDNLDSKYDDQDLLSAECVINISGELDSWDWWKCVPHLLPLPWARSMVCGVRVSKNFLNLLSRWVYKNAHLDLIRLHEFLFPTLALHNGLKIYNPPELKNIVWRRDWGLIDLIPGYLFHPVKDPQQQLDFRAHLSSAIPGSINPKS